jgi:hypothetical protein
MLLKAKRNVRIAGMFAPAPTAHEVVRSCEILTKTGVGL